MASEKTLGHSRSSREGYNDSSVTPPSSRLVARRGQCTEGSTFAPSSTSPSTIYRRLKRRLGRTLRGLHCKRHLVSLGKSPSYKLSRIEGSPSGPESIRASVQGSDCSCCNRQHNSGLLHKQTRRYEVRLSLCRPMETSVLVPSQGNCSESEAHSRSLECDSGQAFQTQPSDSDRMVPISAGVHSLVFQVDPTSSGLVCNPVQSQTTMVCFTGTGSDSLGSRCLESTVGSIGGIRLSPRVSDPPSNLKVEGSGLSQNDPHCSRMAKHALVLGSSEPVGSDSLQATSDKRPGDSTLQRFTESQQSQSPCVAPRIAAIQEHRFSDEVAVRIETPQRSSTRAVYKSKWPIFLKWCQSHKVDFRAPSVNQSFFNTFSKKEICNPVPLRAIEQPLPT